MAYELGHTRDGFKITSAAGNSLEKEEGLSSNSDKNQSRGISNVNEFIANMAKGYMKTTEGDHWTSDLLNHLNNRFPTSTEAPKESTYQKILAQELQNLNQQEMWDVNRHSMASHGLISSHSALLDLLISPGFHKSDSSMNMGYNSASSDISDPEYFEGSAFMDYSQNVASKNISFDGMNLTSRLGVNQADLEFVASSEQESSITTCSHGDGIYDIEAFDSRAVLSGSVLHSISSFSVENFYHHQPFHQGQYGSSIGEKQIPYNMEFTTSLLNDMQSFYSNSSTAQQNFQHNPEAAHILPSNDTTHRSPCGTFLQSQAQMAGSHHLQLASQFDNSNDLNNNSCGPARMPCGTESFCLESRKRKYPLLDPPINGSWNSTGTPVDTLPPKYLNGSMTAGDEFSQEFSASLNQQALPVQLPRLEQWPKTSVHEDVSELTMAWGPKVNSITTEDATGNNQRKNLNVACHEQKSTGTEGSSNTADDEFEKPPSVPSVDCDSVLESENTKIQIAYLDDKDLGFGSRNIKMPSASLAYSFTAAQIKEHLSSFNQHKEISGNATPSASQNICQLCSMDKLLLATAPIYCSSCDSQIKRKVGYYQSTNEEGKEHCFCMACFRGSRGANISICGGGSMSKANLQKANNDEEREDSWVMCDRCQGWQHRICGLYNDEKGAEAKAEYVCPKCCLKEIENGTRVPLPQTAVLGAKDLPRTNLSDHIEQRLFRRLNQEREEMAKVCGIELGKVPGAEGLVVRVVVSVDKQLEVKQQFRDMLPGEDYPSQFAYRSKLIFLFQRLEGVDVCLFGMFVQEFGSECGGPNHRCVYISYLDSVKYFKPERKSVSGESLRTFVYHEILIGYLEHCKKRGFATCYIWACPLIKGEDYIFYCHPETQKAPNQDKLRQWYKLMLRKAAEDDVVLDHTNLYNQFFVPARQGNAKITAARLPYFDGDYWSGAAESIIKKLEEEENSGGWRSKLPNKRTLIAMGHDNPDVVTKDVLVMHELGQTILPLKENFMIARLQYLCTYCHEAILSGSRWFCNQCNKIQLCSRCFDAGKLLSRGRMHRCRSGEDNPLTEDVLSHVSLQTNDVDDVLVNDFFETRDEFWNKCEGSSYQFNTLSHAKYSSIMILYHVMHKLDVQPVCALCHKHILVDQCWHCDICTKHYVCGSCYESKGSACHVHKLTPPSTKVLSETISEQPQKQKALMLQESLDHASQCKSIHCSYSACRAIRKLLHHASICSVRLRNGCKFCQRACRILKEHTRICRDSNCRIPRCPDIRKHIAMLASCSKNNQNTMKSQQ